MQIRAELCHVDTLRCIVRVEAWHDDDLQGSALGEAATAEDAEERALTRLNTRLQLKQELQVHQGTLRRQSRASTKDEQPALGKDPNTRAESAPGAATSPTTQRRPVAEDVPSETPTDPDDWSEELTAIDMEIRRIGWSREQEQAYLTRAFGLGSRHKLTRYADLLAYLRQLKLIQANEDVSTAPAPIRRGELLNQGDLMLKQLCWTSDQARAFLQQHLGATSRQQLKDEQLLKFNMLLEEQTMNMKIDS